MIHKLIHTNEDRALTVLRVTLGAVFFAHGAQKMLGWFGGNGFSGTLSGMERMGIPSFLAFLAILAEFLGGIGLLTGLLARIAGLGVAVDMIVAILLVHLQNGLFMNWAGNQKGEGFEYHLLAVAIATVVAVRGAGAMSLDRAIETWIAGEHPSPHPSYSHLSRG